LSDRGKEAEGHPEFATFLVREVLGETISLRILSTLVYQSRMSVKRAKLSITSHLGVEKRRKTRTGV
jgi:hypothetical protein